MQDTINRMIWITRDPKHKNIIKLSANKICIHGFIGG